MQTLNPIAGSGVMITIGNTADSASIDPNGAYIRSLSLGSKIVLMAAPDEKQTHGGCALLSPFANRIRRGIYHFDNHTYNIPHNNGENAIHGFLKDQVWEVISLEDYSVVLSNSMENSFYPSRLYSTVHYSVGRGQFKVSYSATNGGEKPVPFMLGFHPYFSVGTSWRFIGCREAKELNVEDRYFPDGNFENIDMGSIDCRNATLDNTFFCSEDLILESELFSLRLTRENMPYLQLYNGAYCRGLSLAVEPMTGAPDCFNNGMGLIVMEAGQTFTGGFSVTLVS